MSTSKDMSIFNDLPPPTRYVSSGASIFNPLGTIRDLVSEIIYYKQQIKQLEVQEKAIAAQAKLYHEKINAELTISLEQISAKREAIRLTFMEFSQRNKDASLERKQLLSLLEQHTAIIANKSTTASDRSFSQQYILELTGMLKSLNNERSISLNLITDQVTKILNTAQQNTNFLK